MPISECTDNIWNVNMKKYQCKRNLTAKSMFVFNLKYFVLLIDPMWAE